MKDKVSLVIVYLSMLLVLVMTVLYADYSISENGKKFCDIITTVNDAYQDPDVPEPTTDLGRKLKKNYAELEERLRC